jgi:Flp pilus assembly protein CpaB
MLMNGRRLIVVVAILAIVATAGVFITSRGVQEPGGGAGAMVRIVVSEVDIPARTDLNEFIKDDQVRFVRVPTVALIDGAVTSVGQLRDRQTTVRILAGEQFLASRIVRV